MMGVPARINEKWQAVVILQRHIAVLSMSRWRARDYCLDSEMKGWADLHKLRTVYFRMSTNVTRLVRDKGKAVNSELYKWHASLSLV